MNQRIGENVRSQMCLANSLTFSDTRFYVYLFFCTSMIEISLYKAEEESDIFSLV